MYIPISRINRFINNYLWALGFMRGGKYPVYIIFAVIFGIAGTSANAALVGFISFFIDTMQKKTPLAISIININIENSFHSILILSIISFFILIFGACTTYLAKVFSRKVGRNVHKSIICMVMETLADYKGHDAEKYGVTIPNIRRHAMRNAKHTAIADEIIVLSVQPLMQVIVMLAYTFYINPYITSIFIPAVILLVPPLYLISSYIQKKSRLYFDELIKAFSRNLESLIISIDSLFISKERKDYIVRNYGKTEIVNSYLDGYDEIRMAGDKMSFVIALYNSLFLAFIMFIFGYFTNIRDANWGAMVSYFFALYYLMNGIQHIASAGGLLNKNYPQVVKLIDFVNNCKNINSIKRSSEFERSQNIFLDISPKIDGSTTHIVINRAKPVYYVTTHKLSGLNLFKLISPIIQSSGINDNAWTDADFISCGSIEAYKGLLLEDSGSDNEYRNLEPYEDMDYGKFKDIVSRLLDSAINSINKLLFIDMDVMDYFSRNEQDHIMSQLHDKYIFYVIKPGINLNNTAPDIVLIECDMEIIGAGSVEWYNNCLSSIEEKINKDTSNKERIRINGSNDMDEDDS